MPGIRHLIFDKDLAPRKGALFIAHWHVTCITKCEFRNVRYIMATMLLIFAFMMSVIINFGRRIVHDEHHEPMTKLDKVSPPHVKPETK